MFIGILNCLFVFTFKKCLISKFVILKLFSHINY